MTLEMVITWFTREYKLGKSLDEIENYLSMNNINSGLVAQARKEFESRIHRMISLPSVPTITDDQREEWYPGPLETDRFWPALRTYLVEQKRWTIDVVDSIDQASTGIVARLSNPHDGAFQCRGLVIGHVQSGKTANFTAVMAKAADAGYQVIIVLSGMYNSLRSQTQGRLEEELIGKDTTSWFLMTNSDRDKDFDPPPSPPDSFLTEGQNKRLLFVVKKNVVVLRRLIRWFAGAASGVLSKCPVLVIDDEADQASPDTGKDDERSETNRLILELLDTFKRCSYVGYTATPFANVLIDPSWPRGLYPRDFIVSLDTPQNYFGAQRIFGSDPDDDGEDVQDELDVIRDVPEDDIECLRPLNSKMKDTFVPHMTETLSEAIRWFVVAAAVRLCRGHDTKHMSMLVHVTLYPAVHDAVSALIKAELGQLRESFRKARATLLAALKSQWIDETQRVPAKQMGEMEVNWTQVISRIDEVLTALCVTVDNGQSNDRLSYEDGGSIQIVVGGNTLSRGLTLEGLMVSYFLRASSTYDTLLQMGRWFGYRSGYSDLPRIWMPLHLQDAFAHLARVEAEIREEIARYDRENASPTDFGVRIQTHSTLAVTSRMKMRHAIKAHVSYNGEVKQTTYFKIDDQGWLEENIEAARELLVAADGQERPEIIWDRHWLWRNIPVDYIQAFLERYNVHERHDDMSTVSLREFIQAQVEDGAMKRWNVGVVSVLDSDRTWDGLLPNDRAIKLINRSRYTHSSEPNVKAIMSKVDRAIDLGLDKPPRSSEIGTNVSIVEWIAQRRSPHGERMLEADPATGKRTPLLLLYPIDRNSAPRQTARTRDKLNAVCHIIGLALVFPRTHRDTPREYMTVDLSAVERDEYIPQET